MAFFFTRKSAKRFGVVTEEYKGEITEEEVHGRGQSGASLDYDKDEVSQQNGNVKDQKHAKAGSL